LSEAGRLALRIVAKLEAKSSQGQDAFAPTVAAQLLGKPNLRFLEKRDSVID
jgi:hypothetical protein